MSKVRKPNNNRARLERASRAALRQSKMAVYNIDPSGRQGLFILERAPQRPQPQKPITPVGKRAVLAAQLSLFS